MICKECGIRQTDPRCQYCSECSENRRYFSLLTARHTWATANPDKARADTIRQNASDAAKQRKREYRERNRELLSRKELARYYRKKLDNSGVAQHS